MFVMFYSYCRPRMGLDGKTLTQATGLADHRWALVGVIGLLP